MVVISCIFQRRNTSSKLQNLVQVSEVRLDLILEPSYALVRKCNNICSLHIDYGTSRLINVAPDTSLGTLPIGYRPTFPIHYKIGHSGFRFTITSGGQIRVTGLPSAEQYTTATYINVSYII